LFASIHPDIIWCDDDLKYHGRIDLDFGCVCPLHLKEIGKRLGRVVTPDDVHGWMYHQTTDPPPEKRIWREVLSDALTQVVFRMREGIDSVDPSIRLGMMTSLPSMNTIEGKPFDELPRIAAGNTRPIVRPNVGIYADGDRRRCFAAVDVALLTSTIVDPDCQLAAEIDGHWPHSRFNRSAATLENVVQALTFHGFKDFNFFLHGLLETPLDEEPVWKRMFQDNKPYLDAIIRETIDLDPAKGIQNFFHKDGSLFHRAQVDKWWTFDPSRDMVSQMGLLGLPTSYSNPCCYVIEDDDILAASEADIRTMLKKGTLITLKAARALLERGLGNLIGLKALTKPDIGPTIEVLDNPEMNGDFNGRRLSLGFDPVMYTQSVMIADTLPGAIPVTKLVVPDRSVLGTGMYIFENDDGGRCAVIPYHPGPSAFRCYARAEQLRRTFAWIMRNPLPVAVIGLPDCAIYLRKHKNGQKLTLALWNLSYDPIEDLTLSFNGIAGSNFRVSRLLRNGDLEALDNYKWEISDHEGESILRARLPIAPQAVQVLVLNATEV